MSEAWFTQLTKQQTQPNIKLIPPVSWCSSPFSGGSNDFESDSCDRYADESRRVFMLVWPNDEDLVAYHAKANSRQEAMQAKYDALMAQAEAVKAQMSGNQLPLFLKFQNLFKKNLKCLLPRIRLEVQPSKNGQFSVKHKPRCVVSWMGRFNRSSRVQRMYVEDHPEAPVWDIDCVPETRPKGSWTNGTKAWSKATSTEVLNGLDGSHHPECVVSERLTVIGSVRNEPFLLKKSENHEFWLWIFFIVLFGLTFGPDGYDEY